MALAFVPHLKPLEWTVVLLGVFGAIAALPTVRNAVTWLLSLRGILAGDWCQLTYESDDEALAGPVLYIDLVRIRHYRSSVSGRMWRLFPSNVGSCWRWRGTYDGWTVLGDYRSIRHRAGDGVLHMTRSGRGRLRGKFLESVATDGRETDVVSALYSNPMEWIELTQCSNPAFVQLARQLVDGPLASRLPRRARRRLKRFLNGWEAGESNQTKAPSLTLRRGDVIVDGRTPDASASNSGEEQPNVTRLGA